MTVRPPASHVAVVTLAVAALALTGCAGTAAATSSAVSAADACAVVRTSLTQMASLVDAGLVGVADPSDSDAEDAYATALTGSAAALGGTIGEAEVAAAYASVESALEDFAEAIADADDDAASAAVLKERADAVDTAGAELMRLCATPGDGSLESGAAPREERRVLQPGGVVPREAVAEITPAIQPDSGTREISLTLVGRGSRVPGWVTVEKSTASVLDPLTWGRDWKVSFRTNGMSETWFVFTDESGDSYGMLKIRPSATHTVYYNSDRPAIVKVTGD